MATSVSVTWTLFLSSLEYDPRRLCLALQDDRNRGVLLKCLSKKSVKDLEIPVEIHKSQNFFPYSTRL